jgi:hypothetical protein
MKRENIILLLLLTLLIILFMYKNNITNQITDISMKLIFIIILILLFRFNPIYGCIGLLLIIIFYKSIGIYDKPLHSKYTTFYYDNSIIKQPYKYTAVIVEPREHKALDFVLKNFKENLDEEWGIVIFHGTKNETYLKNIINFDVVFKDIFNTKTKEDEFREVYFKLEKLGHSKFKQLIHAGFLSDHRILLYFFSRKRNGTIYIENDAIFYKGFKPINKNLNQHDGRNLDPIDYNLAYLTGMMSVLTFDLTSISIWMHCYINLIRSCVNSFLRMPRLSILLKSAYSLAVGLYYIIPDKR